MAFVKLVPRPGVRPDAAARITVARHRSKGRTFTEVRVNIPSAIVRRVGWAGPMRIDVLHDAEAGLVRVARSPENAPAADTWAVSWRAGLASFLLRAPGLDGPPMPATAVPFTINEGAITFELPAWARGDVPCPPAPCPEPRPVLDMRLATEPAAKPEAPAQDSEPPLTASPEVLDILGTLTVDEAEQVEALNMLRSKTSAVSLAEWFGWEMPKVAKLTTAYRKQQQSARAFERREAA